MKSKFSIICASFFFVLSFCSFKIADDIDRKYKIAFNRARKTGVKILCYDCKLCDEEIKLNKQINYEQ